MLVTVQFTMHEHSDSVLVESMLILSTAGKPVSLKELVEQGGLQGAQFQLASDDTAVFNCSLHEPGGEKLGKLEIIDTYNEKYLGACTLLEGVCRSCWIACHVFLLSSLLSDEFSLGTSCGSAFARGAGMKITKGTIIRIQVTTFHTERNGQN
jgi:hypothetical protein